MVFFLLLWRWGFWVWRGVVPDWQDMAKASSRDTVVPAKPVDFGCGARWGWNRLPWWNLSFSNTLCIRIRNYSAVQLSQSEMALLRWWQKGAFWYTKCVIRVMCFSFFWAFPVCCWKAAVASHSRAGNHLLMSNPWYWHWSAPDFAMQYHLLSGLAWSSLLLLYHAYNQLLKRKRRGTSGW